MSKHAYFIKAWADGAEVESELTPGNWSPCGAPGTYNAPTWRDEHNYRLKLKSRTVAIKGGLATLEDGSTVNLLTVQRAFLKSDVGYQLMKALTGLNLVDGAWVPVQSATPAKEHSK